MGIFSWFTRAKERQIIAGREKRLLAERERQRLKMIEEARHRRER